MVPVGVEIPPVHREDALHEDPRPARIGLEPVDDPGDVGDDLPGGGSARQVVDADHQEQPLGMPFDDRIEPFGQFARPVGADAAVADVAVVEEFAPLAAVGEAVAQKDDVARADRQQLEQAAPLLPVRLLGAGRAGGEKRGGENQNPFHGLRVI